MSDSVSQPPVAGALLLIGVLALAVQWIRNRRGSPPGSLPGWPFWLGVSAWLLLGLWPAGAGGLRGSWHWLLPGVGLALAGLLRWVTAELPRFLREEEPGATEGYAPPPAGESLDVEDVRLIRRLALLRRQSAEALMQPLAEAPVVRAGCSVAELPGLLAKHCGAPLLVLDDEAPRAVGIITGHDLVRYAPVMRAPGEALPRAGQVCRAVPQVGTVQTADEVLSALRREGCGATAVADAEGQVVGFIHWDHLFRALLGLRPNGVDL